MFKKIFRAVVYAPYKLLIRPIVNALFHIDWYYDAPRVNFLGIGIIQNPMDMWVKQEIIYDAKPEIIIECGTHRGGTALYYAMLLSAMGSEAKVVTIDIGTKLRTADHPLFRKHCLFLSGSSTSDEVVSQVKALAKGKRTLVILDSDHSRDHVRKEMELYGPLVSPGSYLIVEDTNINGHPVAPFNGPGPHEAIESYMKDHPGEFEIDRSREKMRVTFFPGGYLRKR